MMIDAAEHDDPDAVFALKLVERLARLPAYLGLALMERFGESPLIATPGAESSRCPTA